MHTASSVASSPDITHLAHHTRQQIALRLLPFLFLLYILNYLDRTNVAYAAIGMSRELGFSDRVFGLGAGIFFISYVVMQIPGAVLAERWSARRMIALSLIGWGSLTVLTSLVHTPVQLYLARFVLGAAEGGFFPGVVVYLSHWFLHEDRAKATSNFMGAIPLSSVLGSPLAGLILGYAWLGWQGWRWLFVIEGLPVVFLGIAAYLFLTDWPVDAKWLAPEQRLWIEDSLREQQIASSSDRASIVEALKSGVVQTLAIGLFFAYILTYTFVFWFPTILKRQSGLSDLHVGVLGALPFVAYFLAMQIGGWHSDKTSERRWHTSMPLFISAAALLAATAPVHSLAYFMIVFTVVGAGASYVSIAWAMPTEMLSRSLAPTAVGLINATASIAGFAGPYAFGYLYSRNGSFVPGLLVMMLGSLIGGLLILRLPANHA
ncbi:MAG: MFS transporter [Acidobacteriaceae bacterium]|nr:MFS transporter [Acidobacteriaceae bacterium]